MFCGYVVVFISLCKVLFKSSILCCVFFFFFYHLRWDTILMGFPLHLKIVCDYGKFFLDIVVVFQLFHDIHYCVIFH